MSTAAASATAVEQAWRRPRGVRAWLADTSHRATGARLVGTTLGFFALAGVAALVMRSQLARPDGTVVGPETYDQVFTTHGSTMLFLFAVPVMQGIALYVLPLELGTREAALPRLGAFGFWLIAFAGVGMYGALAIGEAPDSGWFNYVPLASPRYQPGFHGDVYAATVILSQSGVICLAITLIATILTKRAPGMSLNLMPLLSWAVLVAMTMVLLAMPAVVVAATLLVFDSKLGTQFFGAAGGGDPLLWQQLFWFYGHPLVYIMLLPGLGVVSTVTATFARRPMVGYPFVVASYVAIGCISFGVWVHHMFAGGHSSAGMAVFSAATMAVAVPSGVHVFAVLATLWHGRVRFQVPLLYVLGFVAIFVLGGISGVMVGATSADWQYHDTYFVVAHLHFVLLGGVVMPALAAVSYWYAKVTGWELGTRLGVVAFGLIVVGVALTFFPMHVAGVLGMPRRVWTYAEEAGWSGLNLASTIGAALTGLGILAFAVNLVASVGRRRARPDPWGSGTLEGALPSPPPRHGLDATPIVETRYPRWEQAALGDADASYGIDVGARESIGTTGAAARPRWREHGPAPSAMPLLAAACVAAGVIGTAIDPLLLGAGLALAFVAIAEWLRPGPAPRPGALPDAEAAAAEGARTPAWWGTTLGLLVLFVAMAALTWSWYYLAAVDRVWPIPPVEPRPWLWAIGLTVLLGAAVALARVALRRVRAGRAPGPALAASAACALAFVALVAVESLDLDYDQAANASASAEFAISWSFALCVLVLAGMAGVATRRPFSPTRHQGLASIGAYAALLGLSWPLVLVTVYVGPRLL
jgi:cytochrome c oxidase subunit I+III